MKAVALALAMAAQSPPPQPPPTLPPLPTEAPPPREASPAHAIFYQDADTAHSTAEARTAQHDFGRCVVRFSASMAAETLAMDFRTRSYRNRLLRMAEANRQSCFRGRGRLRTHNLLFAGGLAEALLLRDSVPLNARLARAALAPAPPTFSPSDAIALCVVRSVPDDVARLFETEVASEAEGRTLVAIAPIAEACNRTGRPFSATDPGLRAILATAAFRSARSVPAAQ